MAGTAILGSQWGDEGKGKITDMLASESDVVARFSGGDNAGHTVVVGGKVFKLHLIPSGILYPDVLCLLGAGMVINPRSLFAELADLADQGADVSPRRLRIDGKAHLIMPYHIALDGASETALGGSAIGTTRRGIGPAYEDVVGRRALFVKDLLREDVFRAKIAPLADYYQRLFSAHGQPIANLNEGIEQYVQAGDFLRPFVCDTTWLLQRAFRSGKKILFEGAQGTLLDINLGTYPFVTSSNTTIAGVFSGTGLPAKAVDRVIGISKAYTTRVGEGPFPSELTDESGRLLREWGNEYGSTTGRPRRVGWLDLVALKYAVQVNGVDSLFLTKLDVLDEMAEIQVVTAYEIDGKSVESFSPHAEVLSQVRPVYRALPGWQKKLGAISRFQDLPGPVHNYLEFIEDFVGVRASHVSIGGERRQTIEISS